MNGKKMIRSGMKGSAQRKLAAAQCVGKFISHHCEFNLKFFTKHPFRYRPFFLFIWYFFLLEIWLYPLYFNQIRGTDLKDHLHMIWLVI